MSVGIATADPTNDVHAFRRPPKDGSDIWCGRRFRITPMMALWLADVTCPECIDAMKANEAYQ